MVVAAVSIGEKCINRIGICPLSRHIDVYRSSLTHNVKPAVGLLVGRSIECHFSDLTAAWMVLNTGGNSDLINSIIDVVSSRRVVVVRRLEHAHTVVKSIDLQRE